jgi:hypothetical protein
MKKFLSGFCATALAASFAVSSVVPVNAAPVFVPKIQSAQSDVIQVQGDGRFDGERWLRNYRGGGENWNRGNFRRNWNGNNFRRNNWRNGNNWRGNNWRYGNNWRRGNDYGWYNGHRGYRNYRRGYRRHGDFWFPAAAFVAGALITGAIVNNNYGNRYYGNRSYGGNAHVSWCYDRYRSYRAYDNTFQPYNGPRRQCYSPYS